MVSTCFLWTVTQFGIVFVMSIAGTLLATGIRGPRWFSFLSISLYCRLSDQNESTGMYEGGEVTCRTVTYDLCLFVNLGYNRLFLVPCYCTSFQGCTSTTICLYCRYTKILAIRSAVPIPIFTAGCINLYDITINGKSWDVTVFAQELITTKFWLLVNFIFVVTNYQVYHFICNFSKFHTFHC